MRVAEYMRSVAVSLPPAASLADAGEAMTAYGLPWVPVVQNGRLLGLVGADDLAAARPSPATTLTVGEITYHLTTIPVSAVMRLDPPVVAPDTPLAEAAGLLRDESVGVLPVVEDGRLVGLLGAGDLIALLAAGGPQGW
jgi:acetoin utilization protein AcuB